MEIATRKIIESDLMLEEQGKLISAVANNPKLLTAVNFLPENSTNSSTNW